MPIMEIKIMPIGTKTASVSGQIARAVAVLRNIKEIQYRLTPMGTVIEGKSRRQLLLLAGRMHQAVLSGGVDRVVTFIELDERKDKPLSMAGKLRSLKKRMKEN